MKFLAMFSCLAGLGTIFGVIALPVLTLMILLVTGKRYALNGNSLAAIGGVCFGALSFGLDYWSLTNVHLILPCLLLEFSVIQLLKIKTGWKVGV